jgi:hypothetical protein
VDIVRLATAVAAATAVGTAVAVQGTRRVAEVEVIPAVVVVVAAGAVPQVVATNLGASPCKQRFLLKS